MELRWHTVRTTRWVTAPLHPDRFGSPLHTFKHTESVQVLQYRNPVKGDLATYAWLDVPTVTKEIDETNGECMPLTGSLRPAGAAAVTEACHDLLKKLEAQPAVQEAHYATPEVVDRQTREAEQMSQAVRRVLCVDCKYGGGAPPEMIDGTCGHPDPTKNGGEIGGEGAGCVHGVLFAGPHFNLPTAG